MRLLTEVRRQLRPRMLVLAFGCGAGFMLILAGVMAVHGRALPLDLAVQSVAVTIRWGPLQPLVDFIAWLNGPRQTIAGFAIVIVVGLLWLRVAPLMVLSALSGSLYSMLSSVVGRARPHAPDAVFTGFAFPSGHAVFFTTNAILLALLIRRRLPRVVARVVIPVLLAVWSVAVISRVSARAHWASDVLAGILLAAGWVTLVMSVRWISAPVLDEPDRVARK